MSDQFGEFNWMIVSSFGMYWGGAFWAPRRSSALRFASDSDAESRLEALHEELRVLKKGGANAR